ncbi:GIY-YIG nuclease family protein [candidate division KSB1 bacterium]|nr:GIY-YIG nuclease family protein [candidate division KSB1 bacterium]
MLQSYQLIIKIDQSISLAIGRMGVVRFCAGCYVYTGSARRNLLPRVRRHLRQKERLHWHIDYLLSKACCRIVAVRISRRLECEWNQTTAGTIICPGFGSRDCRKGCKSHLKKIASNQ